MKTVCAVLEKVNSITIKTIEIPELTSGILVKVYACGVCGTDPHVVKGEFKATKFPSILGHELYGEVVKISKNNDVKCINGEYNVGDLVALVPGKACGECIYCKELPDDEQICPNRTTYGLNVPMSTYPVLGGGYSQYVIIQNGFSVFKVDKTWEFGYGTLLEPVAVTVKAVERGMKFSCPTKLRPLKVFVLGAGTIGLFIALNLREKGIEPYIFDIKQSRIDLAKKLGFSNTYSISIQNYVKDVEENTKLKGLGADLVFECAGTKFAFQISQKLVRRGGTIVELGNFADCGKTLINPSEICRMEHIIIGSVLATSKYYKEAEKVLNKVRMYYEDLISPIFTISQAKEAISNVESKKLGLKTIIDCRGEYAI